jgi:hypothetical protein
MTVIQIRGTSGSGKTTVMRRVMEALGPWTSRFQEGRKNPLYYSNQEGVWVLGHYEATCGGCDTIGSAGKVYELIRVVQERYKAFIPIILCEGLLLSEDVKWSSQLEDLRIVFLTTPPETCVEQIKGRRAEAGNEKPLNTANTLNRVPVIERGRVKLEALGVTCRRAPSEQAVRIILKWIEEAKSS